MESDFTASWVDIDFQERYIIETELGHEIIIFFQVNDAIGYYLVGIGVLFSCSVQFLLRNELQTTRNRHVI